MVSNIIGHTNDILSAAGTVGSIVFSVLTCGKLPCVFGYIDFDIPFSPVISLALQ